MNKLSKAAAAVLLIATSAGASAQLLVHDAAAFMRNIDYQLERLKAFAEAEDLQTDQLEEMEDMLDVARQNLALITAGGRHLESLEYYVENGDLLDIYWQARRMRQFLESAGVLNGQSEESVETVMREEYGLGPMPPFEEMFEEDTEANRSYYERMRRQRERVMNGMAGVGASAGLGSERNAQIDALGEELNRVVDDTRDGESEGTMVATAQLTALQLNVLLRQNERHHCVAGGRW